MEFRAVLPQPREREQCWETGPRGGEGLQLLIITSFSGNLYNEKMTFLQGVKV